MYYIFGHVLQPQLSQVHCDLCIVATVPISSFFTQFASAFMEIASQSIFTFELIVKFMAEMPGWQRFFHDGWNCLDAFVVLTGYEEYLF